MKQFTDIVKVLLEYDFPLVFICRENGRLYLYREIADDDKTVTYEFLEISEETSERLSSGEIEAFDVFQSEADKVKTESITYHED